MMKKICSLFLMLFFCAGLSFAVDEKTPKDSKKKTPEESWTKEEREEYEKRIKELEKEKWGKKKSSDKEDEDTAENP